MEQKKCSSVNFRTWNYLHFLNNLSKKFDWIIFVPPACYFRQAQTRPWAFGTVKQGRGLSA